MIFYSLPDDAVYGECDCNYDIECKSLIYSADYDECFYAYEQVCENPNGIQKYANISFVVSEWLTDWVREHDVIQVSADIGWMEFDSIV